MDPIKAILAARGARRRALLHKEVLTEGAKMAKKTGLSRSYCRRLVRNALTLDLIQAHSGLAL